MEAEYKPRPDEVREAMEANASPLIQAQVLSVEDYNQLLTAYADDATPTEDRDKMVTAIRRLLVTLHVAHENNNKMSEKINHSTAAIVQMLKHGVEVQRGMSPNGPVVVWEFGTNQLLPRHKHGGLKVKFDKGNMIVAWIEPGGGIITRPTSIIKPGVESERCLRSPNEG